MGSSQVQENEYPAFNEILNKELATNQCKDMLPPAHMLLRKPDH